MWSVELIIAQYISHIHRAIVFALSLSVVAREAISLSIILKNSARLILALQALFPDKAQLSLDSFFLLKHLYITQIYWEISAISWKRANNYFGNKSRSFLSKNYLFFYCLWMNEHVNHRVELAQDCQSEELHLSCMVNELGAESQVE